ncbi:MAG: hypothetical protein WC292_07495 [Clostridia bacterium]
MKKTLPIIIIIAIAFGVAAGIVPFDSGAAHAENSYKIEVTYNDFLLSGGDILRNFTFWVDQERVNSGLSVAMQAIVNSQILEAFSNIEDDFEDAGYLVSYTENSGFLEVSLEYYESYTEQYAALGIDGYEKPSSSAQTEKGFFFNTSQINRDTIYKNLKEGAYSEGSPLGLLDAATQKLFSIHNIEESDILYIYNYGTKYSTRLINSDADSIYTHEKLGITIHKFAMDNSEMLREITLTQTSPNAPVWYALVFGATAVVAAVIVGVAVYRVKKKKGSRE